MSHMAGMAPNRMPLMSTSTPRPMPSIARIDCGRPSTYSASSRPIQTFERSTMAESTLSMSTTVIAAIQICTREFALRMSMPPT